MASTSNPPEPGDQPDRRLPVQRVSGRGPGPMREPRPAADGGWIDHRGTVTWEGRSPATVNPPWAGAAGWQVPPGHAVSPYGGSVDLGRARPALSDLIARVFVYLIAAVRFQPRLFIAIVVLCALSSLLAITIVPPRWRVDVRVPVFDETQRITAGVGRASASSDGVGGAGAFQLTPVDLAAILRSPAVRDQLADRLTADRQAAVMTATDEFSEQSAVERLLGHSAAGFVEAPGAAGADGSAPMTSAGVQGLLQRATHRLALAFGFTTKPEPGADSGVVLSEHLRVLAQSAGDGVVRLTVQAQSPALAVSTADALVQLVGEQLQGAIAQNAQRRIDQLAPELDRLNQAKLDARATIEAFRRNEGRQDPAGLAVRLEQDLADLQAERDQIEVTIREQRATRDALALRLEELEANQVGEIVVQSNPRIAELKREISDLEATYNGMTKMTDRHPDKAAVLQQLEAKRRELAAEEQTVIERTTQARSPEHLKVSADLQAADTELVRLGERANGLSRAELDLRTRITEASNAAVELNLLNLAYGRAEAAWMKLDDEAQRLQVVIDDRQRFSYLRPLDLPRVSSVAASPPFRPRGERWLALGLFLGVVGGAGLCALVCAARHRVICRWQFDALVDRLATVHVLADLPALTAAPGTAGVFAAASPD